ncbi:MAG: hypothetical protein QM737_09500 [Ferruginibacter sp.]
MSTSELMLNPATRLNTATDKSNFIQRFINWCESQEKNRMLWIGTSLGIHGCVLTPITLFAVIFSGIHTWMLALTAASIMLTLVVNLAALPLKNAIPVFALSLITNIVIVASAIISGLEIAKFF